MVRDNECFLVVNRKGNRPPKDEVREAKNRSERDERERQGSGQGN
jgi:hypothetical protein